jgi:DNA-3-methyladenine glycosylase
VSPARARHAAGARKESDEDTGGTSADRPRRASGRPLRPAFYARPVLEVARELVGCRVVHEDTEGVIVETEAYHESEPACHAFVGLTPRTRTLFGPPGRAYVYRSYGIHAMLNAVCEPQGVGAAVLIRALAPIRGLELMRERRRRVTREEDLCSGPGKLTQALEIELDLNGGSLATGAVRILPASSDWRDVRVVVGRRVGINHAVELPWRFAAAGDPNVSRPRPPDPLSPPRRGRVRRPSPATAARRTAP